MFRKRLVAVCFLAAFAAQTTLPGVASAQDVIDLDAEAPPPKKGGKPSGKKGKKPDLTCCQDADLMNKTSNLSRRIDFVLTRGGFKAAAVKVVGNAPLLVPGGIVCVRT